MSEKLELISFKLCPFVQRAVIVLKQKQVAFDITYIDLNNPPEWFTQLSPLGKVPVLKVGKDVLFESSVIQEYVDEITPPSLQPADPLTKAKNRAWIAFGGDVIMAQFQMTNATSKDAYLAQKASMMSNLQRLEAEHSGGAFFNGADFTLIDAAYAPVFMRMEWLSKLVKEDFLADLPKLRKWSDGLLAMDSVKHSVVEELPAMYSAMVKNVHEGYVASLS